MTAERRVHRSKSMPSSPWAKSTRKMRTTWFAVLTVAVLNGEAAISTTPAHAKDPSGIVSIQITPEQFTIRGSRDRLQILVTGMNEVGQPFDLTHLAEYTFANPALADVDSQGVVLPKADGRTTIEFSTATARGNSLWRQLGFQSINPSHSTITHSPSWLKLVAAAERVTDRHTAKPVSDCHSSHPTENWTAFPSPENSSDDVSTRSNQRKVYC